MPYLLTVRHKVENYAKWKAAFDSDKEMRKAGGEKSYHIFHMADDPNDLVMLFEWDTWENARKYIASEELREAVRRSGVVGQPEVIELEKIESGTL